ncbi:TonB-dependent receptor [Neptunicella sp. SCSIO 80796]|uniref:TonB-dependent receptor n=1 Tax=Neptunicella plasticusilytica TaxID=3117012 RepID=UPI003A4E15C4
MSEHTNKYWLLAAMSAVVLPLSSMTYAAEDSAEDPDAEKFEQITVTSSRRIQTIQDVPASVTAVNPESFLNTGLSSIGDIIDYTAGFNIDRGNGQRGRGSIAARGVSQTGSTAVTAIYVDDVPMTSNSGFAEGGTLFFDGLLGDVERVELIKGPQGTLFGATAISGAIRYISKEPALFDSRGSITADISTIKDGGVNKQYRGFYSFPIVEDKLGLTLSGFSSDDAGYVDQVDPATGEVLREDANDSENYGYSADLFYEASEDLSFRIKGLKQKSSFGMGSAVRIASLDKDEAYGKLKGDDSFGSDEMENTMLSASMTYEFSGATLDVTTSDVEYEVVRSVDYTQIYGPYLDLLAGNPPGTTTSAPVTYDIYSEKQVHEARLTSKNNDKFEWIAGLYAADESTNNQQSLIGLPTNIVGLIASFPSEYEEVAAFGNLTYYVTPEFDVTAGVRLAKTELALRFIQDGLLLQTSDEQLETAKADIQTYLLTTRYRPNKDTSFYARIASGYRPASSNLSLIDPVTGVLLSQPTIEQDDMWSYEVGVKGDMDNRWFSYDTSLWYITWDNFQSQVYFNGLGTEGNAKDGVTAYGFEGAFTINPGNGFSVTTSVAYSRSTLNEDEPQLYGLKGADLAGVPRWRATSVGRYDFELANGTDAWVGGGFRYTGSSPSSFVNGDETNPLVNIDSDKILMVDLNAGLEWESIQLNFYINNLLNKEAYSGYTARAVPGTDTFNITGIPLQPRTVGASLTYSF